MEQLTGYISHIIFSNKENGYTVFELETDSDLIICVGILHGINEGERVSLQGEFITHAVYGEQFSFNEYSIVEATDEESIRRYLSSGAIKGIGPALAGRIVDYFGEDTFRIMEDEPEKLALIKGISLRKAQEIAGVVIEKNDLRKAMMYLQRYGISNNLAVKIYSEFGIGMYEVMENNPYALAENIDGVGFKTADEIARIAGIATDSVYRIKSGVLYVMSSSVSEGHLYVPKDMLIDEAAKLLEVNESMIWGQVENLSMEKKLIIRQAESVVRVYLSRYYFMELNCARLLKDIDVDSMKDEKRIRSIVSKIGTGDDNQLDDRQVDAVVSSIVHGINIITGGPGTGKTTTINTLIRYFEMNGEDFILAAPTGRAAKRMTETTGYEASTIQRMLGLGPVSGQENGFGYDKNEDNPLETDAIIIDEMSMVDMPLFYSLLKAVVPGTKLVLVGDTNQLPSVGPGSVLKDLIASECFSVVRLEKIFRQAGKSDIIVNAHKINNGDIPVTDNQSSDFFFLQRDNVNVVLKHMIQLVSEKLPKYVGTTSQNIQVLTPMRKGTLGVEGLNPILQKYINPPSVGKKEKEYGGVIFREGDKVMQIKNNYQLEWEVRGKYDIPVDKGLGVFNGDIGNIKSIDTFSEVMEVEYEDNHLVQYPFSALDEIELAYAVTVHKSQGSEYPAVVIPLLTGPKPLLNRNILYTAVTRARKCVTIIGNRDTFVQMINNADETKRYTSFDESIRTIYEEEL